MKIIDNVNTLFGDDLKGCLNTKSKLKVAAATFSIYAYEALKAELETVESFEFIFTSPAFIPQKTTDKLKKEHREFHIPKREMERTLYGSEYEIRLRNKLTQKAIARECADWIRRKCSFRSNATAAPMQQFACLDSETPAAYMPLHGFTAVGLGFQPGNAVSNFINRMDSASETSVYLQLDRKSVV
mgnify:FL=1